MIVSRLGLLVGALVAGSALSQSTGCVKTRSQWLPVTVVNESGSEVRCLVIPPSPSTLWDSAVEDDRRYPIVLAGADRVTLERDRGFTKGPPQRMAPMMFVVEREVGRYQLCWISPEVVKDFPVAVHVREADVAAASPSGRSVNVSTGGLDRTFKEDMIRLFKFHFPDGRVAPTAR